MGRWLGSSSLPLQGIRDTRHGLRSKRAYLEMVFVYMSWGTSRHALSWLRGVLGR
jgi:hypothetical protein